jgi:hypothetical protein
MAKKVTTPNAQKETNQHTFNQEAFIEDITNEKYALIIGSEVVLNKNKNKGTKGNSTNLLLQYVIKRLEETVVFKDKTQISTFNELVLLMSSERIRLTLLDCIRNLNFQIDKIQPDLLELLKSKCFRVVITTALDPYIENAMREIWGDKLKIIDIFKDYNHGGDIEEYKNGTPIPPTLVYAFGKPDCNDINKRFVLTDNETIDCIVKWSSVDRPINLLNYLKEKRILSIGCRLDDWCFRFFWHAFRGDEKLMRAGDIALTLNENSDSDNKLYYYFQSQYVHIEKDATRFLHNTVEQLYMDDDFKLINKARKIGGVFISYAKEDYSTALNLFNSLIEKRIDVWLDSDKIIPGDEFDPKIENAIRQCKVFIPILSETIKNSLKGENERYFKKEWELASVQKKKIIPIEIQGYSCSQPYHYNSEIIPEWIKKVSAFNLEEKGIKGLIKILNNEP